MVSTKRYFCPGQSERNLKVIVCRCPKCGYEVEIFSDEDYTNCPSCKEIVRKQEATSN